MKFRNNRLNIKSNLDIKYNRILINNLVSIFLLFFISSCEITNTDNQNPQEKVVISFIQNDTLDKSVANIRTLKETGKYFGNTNYSLDYPTDGYLSYKIDSINKTVVFTFNPKINFEEAHKLGYLLEDKENGKITDYSINFVVDENSTISGRNSIIIYSKVGAVHYPNDSVPSIMNLLDHKLISKQRKEKEIEAEHELESQKLKEKLNKMDNSDFWNEFDPIVKERVYFLVQNKDCEGLQEEFNSAADNLDRYHASGKSSQKHSKLMEFVNEKLEEIGCY